jgi:hypothetical protein
MLSAMMIYREMHEIWVRNRRRQRGKNSKSKEDGVEAMTHGDVRNVHHGYEDALVDHSAVALPQLLLPL